MARRPSKRRAVISGRDRISELPDPIICQILSNLPTKKAVATSILSKRWKDQWTYCFNLDLNDRDFFRYDPKIGETCYVNDMIKLNKSSCIKKFRLRTDMMNEHDITACLESITRRNVEAIELDDTYSDDDSSDIDFPVELPQSLLTCQTLVFLEITFDCIYHMPPSVYLPRLKVFRVQFYHPINAVTTKLFCGMPALEDLSVSIWFSGYFEKITINIFTPSLKRLKLKMFEVECQIIVKAPSLEEFDIYDDLMAKYVFEELPLDVKARFKGTEMCTAGCEDKVVRSRVIRLMNGISGAKSLALSSCMFGTYFRNAPRHVAMFPNVTCLEVDITSCCAFTFLLYLIDRLPNLVFLALEMVAARTKLFKLFVSPKHVPQCLLLHLKRIEVKGFDGQKCELDMLKYILKFAQVLDEVVIYTRKMALKERICQKLSLFPWGSTNCQLKILKYTSIYK